MTLVDRDRAHRLASLHADADAPPPLPIVRGEGVYLYTEDGRKLLDGISSWWVNIHGHSHPRLNAALADAGAAARARDLRRLHARAGRRTGRAAGRRPAARAHARLLFGQRIDGGRSGDEDGAAVLAQSRASRSARGFVTLHHAYHGDTVGAMSASEDSVFTRAVRAAAVPGARASPYCYRCPLGLERATCQIDCLAIERRWSAGETSPRSSSSRCCRARAA